MPSRVPHLQAWSSCSRVDGCGVYGLHCRSHSPAQLQLQLVAINTEVSGATFALRSEWCPAGRSRRLRRGGVHAEDCHTEGLT